MVKHGKQSRTMMKSGVLVTTTIDFSEQKRWCKKNNKKYNGWLVKMGSLVGANLMSFAILVPIF